MLLSSTFDDDGRLLFDGCRVPAGLCEALAATIESTTTLSEIDLSNNYLPEAVFSRILDAVASNRSVVKLILDGAKIEGTLVKKVANLIAKNSSIVKRVLIFYSLIDLESFFLKIKDKD